MNRNKHGGFTLILAVTALAFLAPAMAILMQTSFSLHFQADQAYVEACNRNLSASGLAWADAHKTQTDTPVQLEVKDLGIPGSALSVTPVKSKDGTTTLQIQTQCQVGQFHLNRTEEYTPLAAGQ